MKAAIVGGAGFIGSNLVDLLVKEGHEVLVVDNLATGYRRNLNPEAPLVEIDVAVDSERLTEALRGSEVVFHTVALPRIARSIEDPLGTHQTNVTGTLRVLKACVDAGVRRVVYSSSSSVYGDQPVMPLTEDMPPNPLNPYACQKYMGELYTRNFNPTYGIETVALRYFNVYGRRQVTEGAYCLVIGIFMDQRKRGEPLTIHGDGQQTRDFTWVGDVARANVLAGVSPNVGKAEVFNIGSGRETTINRIAELIGGPSVHVPGRGFDERFKRAGIQRAYDLLGWQPKVHIEEGIRRLMEPVGATAG